MHALLGKITHITTKKRSEAGAAPVSLEVRFKAACVLPQRTAAPEWLKDQALTTTRLVADAREVGYPGDSIVLTPAESAQWLYPLTVTPGVVYGKLPEMLRLRLRWWKEEKPPEWSVRANGRSGSGSFSREGDDFIASVETATYFEFAPRLPVHFEVTCDRLKVGCSVLPEGEPCCGRLMLPEGERYRLENGWYRLDILSGGYGGAIVSLCEKGRGVDHFRRREDRIQSAVENAGHQDGFQTGWDWADPMKDATLACAGARREGGATRLALEGLADEGKHLRTAVMYTLYDRLPLVGIEREYRFLKEKGKDDEGKEKAQKPKELIDAIEPIALGFRAAWMTDREGASGNRVLWVDGERLAAVRCARVCEWVGRSDWRMAAGWVIAEHPRRREYTMYLFDREWPPCLKMGREAECTVLRPSWPFAPGRPEEAMGYGVALTVGELCGAGVGGGWVACRSVLPAGGVRCAAIGRRSDEDAAGSALFTLAGESREAPLQSVMVPGVGAVLYAVAEFSGGRMEDAFEVTFAGIESRGET